MYSRFCIRTFLPGIILNMPWVPIMNCSWPSIVTHSFPLAMEQYRVFLA